MPADPSPRRQAEHRLFRAYRLFGDASARDAVIAHFMPLARSLARRYRGATEPLEELEQVACLALVRAVESFDASRGTGFSSYAVPSISGAIKRHYRDHGWAVRVPRDLQELALRVERLTEKHMTDSGRTPTAEEVARAAGVSVERVLEAREAMRALHSDSVDQPRGIRDAELTLPDVLGERDEEFARAETRATIDVWLEKLCERDRAIVTLYYRGELTQAVIGRRLGYSQMHVSRLLRNALERMRVTAVAHEGDVAARLAAA